MDARDAGAEENSDVDIARIASTVESRCRSEQALLSKIRAEFQKCSQSGSANRAHISVEDMARYWSQRAEDERMQLGLSALSMDERQAVALRAAQLMRDMDLTHNSRVDLEEWLHYMLLLRSGFSTELVNTMLDKAMESNCRVLQDLQRMFEAADSTQSGVLSFGEVVTLHSKRLWTLQSNGESTARPARRISGSDLGPSASPEQLALNVLRAMDLNADERIGYAEFMAYSLGRRKHEVLLYVYDLSQGAARQLSPWVVGRSMDGIWHTGTVVFGKEYYYSRDLVFAEPGETGFGKPEKILHMGYTWRRQAEFHDFVIEECKPLFQRDTYDVVCNNCNHFTDQACMFLVGRHPPQDVMQQPDNLLRSRSVRVVKPLLNWWLRDRIVVREHGSTLPSADVRLHPGEDLPVGSVVLVHTHRHAGPVVLGQVVRRPRPLAPFMDADNGGPRCHIEIPKTLSVGFCGAGAPAACSSSLLCGSCGLERTFTTASRSAPGTDSVWVQYFDITPAGNGVCRGHIRVENFQRSQLSSACLRDLNVEAFYRRALAAIQPSGSLAVEDPYRASQGIAPRRVPVPGAMLADAHAEPPPPALHI